MSDKFINVTGLGAIRTWVLTKLGLKQDTLVSGTNIKTINNTSLLGSGNVDIENDVFVAQAGTTTYDELKAAIESKKKIFVLADYGGVDGGQYGMCMPSYIHYAEDGVYMELYAEASYHEIHVNKQSQWSHETFGFSELISPAGENNYGLMKLNPSENITMNADGQLQVGGRMGQFSGTTGLFAPNDREPRMVNNYALLMTDAKGMNMASNRALAVVSGYGITCQSAAAGSTVYRISNTYANRILAKCAEGGFASRDEATSTKEQIVQVLSVKIGGADFTPDSAADNSSKPIEITVAKTLNPDSAITSIRLFGTMNAYATAYIGNGISAPNGGGRGLLIGGGVTKSGSGNDNCIVGNGMFTSGNGNAMFGRYHIARKNRGFFAGTGHDSTNAPSEGASAVGQYSFMDAYTLFAVGNGTGHRNRSNAFEVRTDGIVVKSPNGTRYKIAVSDSGEISATAL